MNIAINNCSLKCLDFAFTKWYPAGSLANKAFGFQSVRWRKPIWMPRAPSKLYIINQRKRLPPEEDAELRRLYQNFKCFMKLVSAHCKEENRIKDEKGQLSEFMIQQEEDEHQRMMEFNRQENERIAAIRAERLAKEREDLIREAQELLEKDAEMRKLQREVALRKIEATEKLVATFIEPDDMLTAIENAINNPTDYNYAIDEEGLVYRGRRTQPHLVDKDTLERLDIIDEGLTNVFH